jgi:hypothetical protein
MGDDVVVINWIYIICMGTETFDSFVKYFVLTEVNIVYIFLNQNQCNSDVHVLFLQILQHVYKLKKSYFF